MGLEIKIMFIFTKVIAKPMEWEDTSRKESTWREMGQTLGKGNRSGDREGMIIEVRVGPEE